VNPHRIFDGIVLPLLKPVEAMGERSLSSDLSAQALIDQRGDGDNLQRYR